MPENEVEFHLEQFFRFLEANNYTLSHNLGININNLGVFTSLKVVARMQSANISASEALTRVLVSDIIIILKFLLLLDSDCYNPTFWGFVYDCGELLTDINNNDIGSFVKAIGSGAMSGGVFTSMENQIEAKIQYLIRQDPSVLSQFQKVAMMQCSISRPS